ncbi:DUF58 domain-containing protein [Leptolyngbya sp. FACHB-17]|uniref:DUF58 domain-containing protein n=1 Tax=unclassified Leptolyngbya TaxID=2650499 RepID=UPI0016818152|nr:DUF58 domain-containing protein [Leptolyngbya sp. FACHB-17]MBD2083319.1 DUF58 domain-containing protein [Leptolyngbya sp. FACHB-17]
MRSVTRLTDWLESRWTNPAYSGWLLGGMGLFFFLAATNSMAGWLYIMSGVVFALMAIAAVLSRRTLQGLTLTRRPIQPVSVGEPVTIELLIQNSTRQRKSLIQAEDLIPSVLGSPVQRVVELINPNNSYYWVYQYPATRRGIYRWHEVRLRTAAPLGLFWSRKSFQIDAIALIYPTVLPLQRCPLIDQLGQQNSLQLQAQRPIPATEGMTRSLRPYRWGDPMRIIHWRSSARYGELRVRELETFTSGREIVVAIDSAANWKAEAFEEAVTAAASLYFYGDRQTLPIRLWTAGTGLIRGRSAVLETLAEIQPDEDTQFSPLLDATVIWLTQNPQSLNILPSDSRWVLWGDQMPSSVHPGIIVGRERSLQSQLQDKV